MYSIYNSGHVFADDDPAPIGQAYAILPTGTKDSGREVKSFRSEKEAWEYLYTELWNTAPPAWVKNIPA